MRILLCAVLLMFVVTGCAGVQPASDSGSSSGLSKEQLKEMGVDENKGGY
jgi:hypothetical protein